MTNEGALAAAAYLEDELALRPALAGCPPILMLTVEPLGFYVLGLSGADAAEWVPKLPWGLGVFFGWRPARRDWTGEGEIA